MPRVVVAGAILQCSHGGQVRLSSGNSKLQVSDKAVVTAGMEVGLSFAPLGSPPTPSQPAPCPIQGPGSPPPPTPCTATLAATSGVSQLLTVDGAGALLSSAGGNTVNSTSPGTWSIADPGQTLLEA